MPASRASQMASWPVVMALKAPQAPACHMAKEKAAMPASQPAAQTRTERRPKQSQRKMQQPMGTSAKDCLHRAEQAQSRPAGRARFIDAQKMPAEAKKTPSAVCQGMQGKQWMPKTKPAVASRGSGSPSLDRLKQRLR